MRRERPPDMMIDRSKTMACDPLEMNQAVLRHGIAQMCAHYVRHHEFFSVDWLTLWVPKQFEAFPAKQNRDMAA